MFTFYQRITVTQSDPGPGALLQVRTWSSSALKNIIIHLRKRLTKGNGLNFSRKPISKFFERQATRSHTNNFRLSILSTPNSSGRTLPLKFLIKKTSIWYLCLGQLRHESKSECILFSKSLIKVSAL